MKKGNGIMATIKDVAMEAGVSIGTVSNVINGKTNNQALIKRVDVAIKKLNFRPDAKARSLKNTRTGLIGVLVNNIEDYRNYTMLSAIEKELGSKGYQILVKTTENNHILEQKHIEYFIQQRVEGIIVNTAIPDKKWMSQVAKIQLPVVMIDRRIHLEKMMKVIFVNYEKAFRDCFSWCKSQGKATIGIIIEKGMIDPKDLTAYGEQQGVTVVPKIIGSCTMESGFKATYELFHEHPETSTLILGGQAIGHGATKALSMQGYSKGAVSKICIKSENWMEDQGNYEGIIDIHVYQIGVNAVKLLLESIKQNTASTTEIHQMEAVFHPMKQKEAVVAPKGQEKIQIHAAVLDTDMIKVLEMLKPVYERQHSIEMVFHKMSYQRLWKQLHGEIDQGGTSYDIYMYDLVWLEDLARKEGLEDLSKLWVEKREYFETLIQSIIEQGCVYQQKLYGLPFMTGTQLLFYQKDLFEDRSLQLKYKRLYGGKLRVPNNWDEFNNVAEFFTKKFNESSPVKYGTTLCHGGNMNTSIEFLNRLWAYGGELFGDRGINNVCASIALHSYLQSFRYVNPDRINASWEEMANQFKSGDTAMVVLYDSYAFGLNDSMKSKTAGNIGSALIPGKASVLGGWNLGINPHSAQKEQALQFILWACGDEIADPFSVLAGISNRRLFYENKELDGLYPWKKHVLESYQISRKRECISDCTGTKWNIDFYESVIGKEIGKAILGEQSEEVTLDRIKNYLEKIEPNV